MVIGEADLAITVHLPPEGMIWNYETNKLEPCEVIVRSMIKADQYWERPEPPKDYAKRVAKEKEIRKIDPSYFDNELQKYRAREWHRRKFGVWFMNNGKMTYLTGLHYYYLTHWVIDIGYPDFRYADLKKAYFSSYCDQDPDCFGFVEVTMRRAGKTYWGGAYITEYVTRTPNTWAGIQSKVESDAKDVFGKAVVQPFRKVVDFFRPEYDKSQGDVPKKELRFYKTSKKGGQDAIEYDNRSELESSINYKNSKPEAYDGSKLHRYLCDEVFKTKDVNILDRHDVVKHCLLDSNRNIIGKALYTSTVEEMEGYIDHYIELWDNSDQLKKLSNNRTKSGLYRFFSPTQSFMYLDKYGFADEARALEELMKARADLADDPRALASFIRKNPTNWKEAFRTNGNDCLYNSIKIDNRLDTLNWKKDNYKKYDLLWEDEEKTKVKLSENSKGRFKFCWTFENDGDPDLANNVQIRGDNVIPKNILRFVIGIDPYDHNRTKSGGFSNGAAAVYMKFDSMNQDDSDNFIGIYCARPQTSQLFYEDMIKLCHYFGCQMLFEDQKQGIRMYFEQRGYSAFMMRDDKGNFGISASQKTHQEIVEHTELFIDDQCHRVKFPELLTDWKNFKMDDTTAFDLGMASGYALMAAAKIKTRQKMLSKRMVNKMPQLQRRYKLSKRPFFKV